MNEVGRIDLDRMVRLTGKSQDALVQELTGLIYLNPESSRWETADQYLAGNVKAKLKTAEKAALNNPHFAQNVDALKLVQPADIEPVDIAIQLGSTWVPETVVDQFVSHLLGGVHRTISYQESLGKRGREDRAGGQNHYARNVGHGRRAGPTISSSAF